MIMNGTNIIQLKALGVIMKDSRSFISGALKKFPKTFGLIERKKGYFPYMFDTTFNRNYSGSWPDKEHYAPDRMMAEERIEFLEWYDLQKDKVCTLYLQQCFFCTFFYISEV